MRKHQVEVIEALNSPATRAFDSLPLRIHGRGARSFHLRIHAFLNPAARENPFLEDRCVQGFVALNGRRPEARALAVLDKRYCRHWNEHIGHLVMFEAVRDGIESSLVLLEAASAWFHEHGCTAVRAGFGPWEPGFALDEYQLLRPRMMRHTAPWYHTFLKQAGFEAEKGGAEYILCFRHDSVQSFEGHVADAASQGYRIASLASLPISQCVEEVHRNWNSTFSQHWGLAPMTVPEVERLLQSAPESEILPLSALAYTQSGAVAGIVLVSRDLPTESRLLPSRYLVSSANTLAVGVDEAHRGRRLAAALASFSYLRLVRRGAKRFSYGIILDDNLTSRRSALRLGARVSGNYLTYKKDLS